MQPVLMNLPAKIPTFETKIPIRAKPERAHRCDEAATDLVSRIVSVILEQGGPIGRVDRGQTSGEERRARACVHWPRRSL